MVSQKCHLKTKKPAVKRRLNDEVLRLAIRQQLVPVPALFKNKINNNIMSRRHFEQMDGKPKDVDDPTIAIGQKKSLVLEELMVSLNILKEDSDCLPQRAFDVGSQPDNQRPSTSTSIQLPPRAIDCELQRQKQRDQLDLQWSHKTHLAKTGEFLLHLYQHDQLSDVIVQCGTHTFSAHAVTLTCHSTFFCHVLLDDTRHADNHRHVSLSPEVSPTAFHSLLDYMYTGDLQIDPENIAELLSASLTLGMDAVAGRCDAEMDKMSPENGLVVWEMAERNSLHAIATKAIKIIGRNFHAVVKSLPFLSLDFERITQLLQRDDLPVTSEYDVGEAAVAWLHHAELERYAHIVRVMSCIRLPLLTSKELFNIINKDESIFQNKEVQHMFMTANWLATGRLLEVPCGLKATLPTTRNSDVSMTSEQDGEPIKLAKQNFKTEATTIHRTKDLSEANNNSTKPKCVISVDPCLDEDGESSGSEIGVTSDGSVENRDMPPVTVKRLILLGGYDPDGHGSWTANATLTYNRASHMWLSHVDMPEPRAHHAAVVVNDTIYVIGGNDPSNSCQEFLVPQKTVFAFHLKKGKWQQVAALSTPRTRHRACVLDNKIYVIGGRNEQGVLSSVERYDDGLDSWENVTSMTCPRLGACVASYRQQVVIAGGYDPSKTGNHSLLSKVEFINPKTGSSVLKSPLRTPRCRGSLVVAGELLLLCGGLQQTGVAGDKCHGQCPTISMAAIDMYNEATDTWSILTEMAVPRHQVAAASLGGKLYLVGGMSSMTSVASDSVECYDMVSATWEKDVKPLPHALMGCEMVAVTLSF